MSISAMPEDAARIAAAAALAIFYGMYLVDKLKGGRGAGLKYLACAAVFLYAAGMGVKAGRSLLGDLFRLLAVYYGVKLAVSYLRCGGWREMAEEMFNLAIFAAGGFIVKGVLDVKLPAWKILTTGYMIIFCWQIFLNLIVEARLLALYLRPFFKEKSVLAVAEAVNEIDNDMPGREKRLKVIICATACWYPIAGLVKFPAGFAWLLKVMVALAAVSGIAALNHLLGDDSDYHVMGVVEAATNFVESLLLYWMFI